MMYRKFYSALPEDDGNNAGGGDAESTQTDTPNAGSNSSIDTSDNPSSEDHGEASGSK